MAGRIRRISAADWDALVEAVFSGFQKEPKAVTRDLPEAARILRRLVPTNKPTPENPLPRLTEPEKVQRLRSFRDKISRMRQEGKAFSKQTAIEALEDAAALTESSLYAALELDREDLANLVKLVTGRSLSKKGKPTRWEREQGEAARVVSILRGVRCHLTWDKRLLAIEIDPKQIALGERAMKFVGIGRDTADDVAERHDDYLAGVLD